MEGGLLGMSCGGDTVPADIDGKLKLKDGSCCGCMTISAELSGYFQKSDACDGFGDGCFDHTAQCQLPISCSVEQPPGVDCDSSDLDTGFVGESTTTCCNNSPFCAGNIYGGPCCVITECNFVGGPGFTGFHCGNVTCQAYTNVGRICCGDVLGPYLHSDCVGGFEPCGEECDEDSDCPDQIGPCPNGFCFGNTEGAPCTTEDDCHFPRICIDGRCSGCTGTSGFDHDPLCRSGECHADCPTCLGPAGGCDTDWLKANDPTFFYNGFEVAGCVHQVAEDDYLEMGYPAGYFVSFWVYLQFGCNGMYLKQYDFYDSGMVFYLGATPPTGSHTFDWDDCDLDPFDCCGLEGVHYSVTCNFA
jgi:hypothetical protein